MPSEKVKAEVLLTNPPDPHNWVSKYADYLYGYAITRVNDEELARDLVQETFLAALEGIDKFEGRSLENTWLTAILKNKIADVYRKKSSVSPMGTELMNAEQEQQDFFEPGTGHWKLKHEPQLFGMEGLDPMTNKEFMRILQKCMQRLPILWLAVFTMKHMEDQPTETICSVLKVSTANFWVIIHRAKVSLRACLQKNWV